MLERFLSSALTCALALGLSSALEAQFVRGVIDTANAPNIRWTVRHGNDVLGISNVGGTFIWDPLTLTWTSTGATAIGSFGVFVTRGSTAAHWDGININEWNGAQWVASSVSGTLPSPFVGNIGAAGLPSGEIVLFGGINTSTFTYENKTFRLSTGNVWSDVTPVGSPAARDAPLMAADDNGDVLMFGGQNAISMFADTWSFNGTNWSQLSVSGSPAARRFGGLHFRSSTGSWVMFGGQGASGNLADAWVFDGSTWSSVPVSYTATAGMTNCALHAPTDEFIAVELGGARTFVSGISGYEAFGAGCVCTGQTTAFALGATGATTLGSVYTLTFNNFSVGNPMWVAFDTTPLVPPVQIPGLPTGCMQSISGPAGNILVSANPQLSPAPTLDIDVSATTPIIGLKIVFQAVQLNFSPFAGCSSNGLDLRIGR